jgi:septum formation protein
MTHIPNEAPSSIITIPKLVLASGSIYRRQLLNKLAIPYNYHAPNVDETPLAGESPTQLVLRLALAKARAVAVGYPDALVIGSDQVAVLADQIITKPRNHLQAKAQLERASGRQVIFLTGLCLLNNANCSHQLEIASYKVNFLPLTDNQIEQYLQKEKPYDCAGSFKAESLGITLCSSFEGEDPNALIGLPLIALIKMLRHEGFEPLSS